MDGRTTVHVARNHRARSSTVIACNVVVEVTHKSGRGLNSQLNERKYVP